MNSWQRVQTRRRLHLVAIIVSTAGLIAAIYFWSPETLDRLSEAVLGQTSHKPYVAPVQEETQNNKTTSKKPAKRVRRAVTVAVAEVPEPTPVRVMQKPSARVPVESHA